MATHFNQGEWKTPQPSLPRNQYRAKNGAVQYRPSMEQAMAADNEGFCLACGQTEHGVEPDARKYKCNSCGAYKLYGFEELVLRGIVY